MDELEPCPHMKGAIQKLAEGERKGFWLWLALKHVVRCPHCLVAYKALTLYFQAMREKPGTPVDVNWSAVWDGVEAEPDRA